ncbi:MAG: hypothetical protein ACLFNY_06415 [Candidatus Aenigmatarchaeota archaeon]
MTETEIDKLREKFLEIVQEDEEKEQLKENLKDEFLKDEMVALLKSADVEPDKNLTKDDLSDEMLSEEFISKVEKEFSPPEEKEEITIKRKKGAIMDELLSPSRLFMKFRTGEYGTMEEFWEDLQKRIKSGFKDFKMPPQEYWETVEKEWKKKVQKIQKNINQLSETEIPQEDLEELNRLWKEFVKEMNLHLGEIPIELQLRKNKVIEIIKDHSQESKELIAEKDFKELYPLWFDMLEEVREELEEARDYMEDKEEDIYDEWEDFRDEFTMEIEAMAVEHADQMEDVDELWSSLSENFEEKLAKGFEEHDHIYRAFWQEVGREKPMMLKKFKEIREKVEKDYSNVVEDALESIKKGYEEMMAPVEREKDEEIDELKERIEELEKKLEEKED